MVRQRVAQRVVGVRVVRVQRDDLAQHAFQVGQPVLALVQHCQFVLDFNGVGQGLVRGFQRADRLGHAVGIAQNLRLRQHAQRAFLFVLRAGRVNHGQRVVDAATLGAQRRLAHAHGIAQRGVVDAAQFIDGFVVIALVFGNARQQHMRVGGGRAGVGGARHRGALALVLHVQVLLKQVLGLRQLAGLVRQLRLHEKQVEVFRRPARHGLQFGQRPAVVAAVGQLARQHQANLAGAGIAVDIGTGIGLGALRVHLEPVFQHALGGGFGFGIGGQRRAGFLRGAFVVACGGGHVGQGQMGGGQLAHAVAQGFVKNAQRQAAVVQAAEHGQRLADGGRLVARCVDAVAQRLGQALGLPIGGGKRQFGGTGFDIVGRQARPDTGRFQGAGQVAARQLEFQPAPRQAGVACVAGQAHHGGRRRAVHATLGGDL
ncbi:hypothetical protein D3C86_1273580 [compost metagenome]